MLSMANVTPSDTTAPYFLPGGTQVVVNFADWFDNNGIVAAVDEDADGSAVSGTDRVWTGTQAHGGPSVFDCLAWSSSSLGNSFSQMIQRSAKALLSVWVPA